MKKSFTAVTKSLAALVLFLLMGIGVQAQSFNTIPLPENGDKLSGTTVELTSPENALPIIRLEIQTNYDYNNPQLPAEDMLRVLFLQTVGDLIIERDDVLRAVNDGYNEMLLHSDNWPGVVDETWKDDMFILLSI